MNSGSELKHHPAPKAIRSLRGISMVRFVAIQTGRKILAEGRESIKQMSFLLL